MKTGDSEIRTLFGVASSLHVNFYENWSMLESVVQHLEDVARLLDKLRPLAG